MMDGMDWMDFLLPEEEDDIVDPDFDIDDDDFGFVDADVDFVEDEETEDNEDNEDAEDTEDGDIGGHDGHRHRLRRQLLRDGFDSVRQRELLELMLCCVQPRQDVNAVCDELMEHYGDLRDLLKGDLQEFLQFEGLGEDGAYWLDDICTLARMCCRLKRQDGAKIANFQQLYRYARRLMSKNKKPCCIQLLTNESDWLMYQRKFASDLRWGEHPVMNSAVDDAFSLRAKNSYLLVFTDRPQDHPSEYDLRSLHNYTLLLQYSKCTPRDVLFMNETRCVSLNRMRMMNNLIEFPRWRADSVAGDGDLPLPEGGLILHRIRET